MLARKEVFKSSREKSFNQFNQFGRLEPKISLQRAMFFIDPRLPISSIRMGIKRALDRAALQGIVNPSIVIIGDKENLLDDASNHITKNLKAKFESISLVLTTKENLFAEVRKSQGDVVIVLMSKEDYEESRVGFEQLKESIRMEMRDIKGKLMKALKDKDREGVVSGLDRVAELAESVREKGMVEESMKIADEINFFEIVGEARSFLQE